MTLRLICFDLKIMYCTRMELFHNTLSIKKKSFMSRRLLDTDVDSKESKNYKRRAMKIIKQAIKISVSVLFWMLSWDLARIRNFFDNFSQISEHSCCSFAHLMGRTRTRKSRRNALYGEEDKHQFPRRLSFSKIRKL